jgi:hypothetical protein
MPKGVTTLVFNKPKELVTKEEDAVNKKKKIRSIVGDDAKLTEGLDNSTDWWNAMIDQHPPRTHIQLDVFMNVLETMKPNQLVTNSTIYTSCRERFQAIIKEGARTGTRGQFPAPYSCHTSTSASYWYQLDIQPECYFAFEKRCSKGSFDGVLRAARRSFTYGMPIA